MAPRLTPQQKALRTITEKAWQKMVTDLLTAYGWRFYHAPDNRPGANGRIQNVKAGYPDLHATRGTRSVYAELKRETGRTTPEQEAWLADLKAAGHETYVWRPRDIAEVRAALRPDWSV